MAETTTIQVSLKVWQYLNGKKRPGESFDSVLRRELDIGNDVEEIEADGGAGEDRVECPKCGGEVPDADYLLDEHDCR